MSPPLASERPVTFERGRGTCSSSERRSSSIPGRHISFEPPERPNMTESGPRVYIVKISIKGDVAITSKPARNFSSFKELLSDAGPYEVSAYDPNTRQYLSCGSDNVFIETTFSSSKNQEKLNKGLIALHSEAMYKPQSHVQYAVRFSSIVKVLCFRVLRNRDGIVIDDFQVVPPSEEFAHGASRSVPGWV